MLQNIRIVLVETSHTGNMGSVARAMKTMGLTNLWLVNPLVKPDSQACLLYTSAKYRPGGNEYSGDHESGGDGAGRHFDTRLYE